MKRLIAILMIAVMLTGCQLAQQDATNESVMNPAQDRLAGILVTTDQETPIMDGEPLHYFSNEGKKFYAEYMEETWYDDEGESRIVRGYEFPEGTGMYFMGYRVDTGTETVYWSHNISQELDATRNAYYNDDRVELEAVIYVAEGSGISIHVLPVYQEADGDVYALGTVGGVLAATAPGMAFSYGGEVEIDGEMVHQSAAKLTIEVIRPAVKYVIVCMDENNQILGSAEYAAGEVPGELIPAAGTAYLILESYAQDGKVERFVYGPEEEHTGIETFRALENGICVKDYTDINWEGSE